MSDEDLLSRARQGDDEAFANLCERHRRRVWRTVSAVTRRGVDAEDLMQETFIKAYCALGSFRGEAPFSAYLTRIAVNVAHDFAKSAWRRRVQFWKENRPDEPDLNALSVDDTAAQDEVKRRVRRAVATLGPKERVPIHLIYFEEFSLAEVARLEGIPESTIRSRVKAGMRQLERQLSDLTPGENPWKECPDA